MTKENPRIVIAGSVNSSRKTLEKLFEHNLNVVGVLGLDPAISENVSGYVDLRGYAENEGVSFQYFRKINSDETVQFVEECKPDYLFVVGLSQMVREKLLQIPTEGCVGFHPTRLPEGRGRAAVAWLILGKAPAAATFFLMGAGMDDGPILVQEPFEVGEQDYAQDVIDKIVSKIGDGLDVILPKMKTGKLDLQEQDHSRATYLGKRNPEDGFIDWHQPADDIVRLVRAVSSPLPGAFSYYNGTRVVIEKAVVEKNLVYTGVTGRILDVNPSGGILIQAGSGLVRLQKISGIDPGELRVGKKFYTLTDHVMEVMENKLVKPVESLQNE